MSVRAYYRPGHAESPLIAATAEELGRIIDDLLEQPFEYSMANFYIAERETEDPIVELSVGVDPDRGVGSLQFLNGEGRWFSKGHTSTYDEVSYCYYGNGCTYPRDSELPVEALRAAAAEFLSSDGERPASVAWQEA
ncbi:Imm1 family immunity protein [Glycomyces sp. NRRL B-16210]|uniref:Imm1 family immunity protein n=1 Tax=Glycomyces sp. NRRL B-16210 TaxID=1463821 RepID=UPI0004C0EA41|nr:Imm1 family immunity protein [Glycomyces sp. NRRL B-16210]